MTPRSRGIQLEAFKQQQDVLESKPQPPGPVSAYESKRIYDLGMQAGRRTGKHEHEAQLHAASAQLESERKARGNNCCRKALRI